MDCLATVNLGNPQTWHDPTMAVKHGKLNRRTNNTAHHARKTRAMITQCKISRQHSVKSFPFTGYSHPTCQKTEQHHISEGVLTTHRLSSPRPPKSFDRTKIFYSHWSTFTFI